MNISLPVKEVDYSIGCHVWREIPEGTIGVRPGAFMAAMDRFDIKIKGQGAAPVHSPKFDFNEDILPLGVETHCQIALELLKAG